MTMARKLYLITSLEHGSPPDPSAWRTDAERDWEVDAAGKEFLTREEAFRAWFQLADLHTETVSAAGSAGWLRRKVQQMTTSYSGPGAQRLAASSYRVREWRDDSEIMAIASVSPKEREELEAEAANGGPTPRFRRHIALLPPAQPLTARGDKRRRASAEDILRVGSVASLKSRPTPRGAV